MKFTLAWLNNFVSTEGFTATAIADRLTMLGLEVDAVEQLYEDLEPIIIARVDSVQKHPNADKLSVCEVYTGKETIQVVCGAPNVRPGLVTALAQPGVTLPDGLTLKKAKVRGQVSMGMLCSARELNLSTDHSGIMELDATLTPGVSLCDALDLHDTLIEVDLTPNRPDCASVLGIAREVAAYVKQPLQPLVQELLAHDGDEQSLDYTISIEDPDLCPRYCARKLTNVSISPSPDWMQRRLLAVGLRPINNIVDITNYVMLESGQPLHAFDFQTLRKKQVIIRRPKSTESTFTTLDSQERKLDPDMLMICDGEGPVAVAGVMGGENSEVREQTTEVLLESACFNSVSIRKTARKLNLPSDASYRFERGVDPDLADKALSRAVELMVAHAGAQVEPVGIDLYPGKKDESVLNLRVKRANTLLGTQLSDAEVSEHLQSIGFAVILQEEGLLEVRVPSFRIDIEREVDLVEEIARLVGYNEIPTTLPKIGMHLPEADSIRQLRTQIAQTLVSQGFYEAINYSFVPRSYPDDMLIAADDQRRTGTDLLNPLTEEQAVMRTMLLPSLLENVRGNINHQQTALRLFEVGKVFFQHEAGVQPEERYQVCAVMTGDRYPEAHPLYFADQKSDFFDLKGMTQSLFSSLRLTGQEGDLHYSTMRDGQVGEPYADSALHVGIWNGSTQIGSLGAVKAEVLKTFGIKQAVFFVELDVQSMASLKKVSKNFTALPKFPSVKRDIALLVPETVPAGDILQAVVEQKQQLLEHIDIFDIYQGSGIEDGMKSVALNVTYRSQTATLSDKKVDKMHKKIVDRLMSLFGARYREGAEE